MKIGSKYEAGYVFPKHWEQLCKEVNYRYLAMVDLIEVLGCKIKNMVKQEKEQLRANNINDPIFDKIINVVVSNIDQTLKQFAETKNTV